MTSGWGMTIAGILAPIVVGLVIGLWRHVRTDIAREAVVDLHARQIRDLTERLDNFANHRSKT